MGPSPHGASYGRMGSVDAANQKGEGRVDPNIGNFASAVKSSGGDAPGKMKKPTHRGGDERAGRFAGIEETAVPVEDPNKQQRMSGTAAKGQTKPAHHCRRRTHSPAGDGPPSGQACEPSPRAASMPLVAHFGNAISVPRCYRREITRCWRLRLTHTGRRTKKARWWEQNLGIHP
jgi:hypothetical protein